MTRELRRGGRTRRRGLRGGVAVAVVILLAALAVPATADKSSKTPIKAGNFSGKTSQGLHMALKVKNKKRTLTVVFFELKAPPCGGGTSEGGPLQYAGLSAKVNRIGHFKAESPGNGFYGFVEGDLHRNKASGTAVYHVASRGCDSGEITWHATHER